MTTRTFTRDELDTLGVPFDLPEGDELHSEQIDTRRWVSVHQLIFRAPDDGKAWAITYERGLTEHQDGIDLWDEAPEVTATEMELRLDTVQQWHPVSDTAGPQTISPEAARHVLFHFGVLGGIRPGRGTETLLLAFDAADHTREAVLTTAFPELGAAFRLAKYNPAGIAQLQAIAATSG
jgi:hypothetical protein